MDIEGLGYKTVDLLLGAGLVADPADIFELRPEDLLDKEGWGEVSVGNLMDAIDAARDRPLARLLTALGIPLVGGTVARVLARRFPSMEAIEAASEEELAAIDGIGPEIARSVVEWFADKEHRRLIAKLAAAGVRLEDPEPEQAVGNLLEGITVVITGTLTGFSRDEAKAAIGDRGGRVTGSVSNRTTAVVVGENPGSKAERAEALGVPVLDEAALVRLLEEGPEAVGLAG
jgi:DNA ligase (NAD+)